MYTTLNHAPVIKYVHNIIYILICNIRNITHRVVYNYDVVLMTTINGCEYCNKTLLTSYQRQHV